MIRTRDCGGAVTFDQIPAGLAVFLDANCLVYDAAFDPTNGPACTFGPGDPQRARLAAAGWLRRAGRAGPGRWQNFIHGLSASVAPPGD